MKLKERQTSRTENGWKKKTENYVACSEWCVNGKMYEVKSRLKVYNMKKIYKNTNYV